MITDQAPSETWPKSYPIRHHQDKEKISWALYSPDEQYRYRLRRHWAEGKRVAFLMLNPSTADEMKNDPTVARCEQRAIRLGYTGFEVINIFALRSTDPKGLYTHDNPQGSKNLFAIEQAISSVDDVICAWGAHGALLDQSAKIRKLITDLGGRCFHLGLTQKGEPKHPLYLPYDLQPIAWTLHP